MWLKYVYFFLIIANGVLSSQADLKSIGRNLKRAVAVNGEDGRSSLVFVFDTTGSMYNDLRQLREGAEMILNTALEESDIIADFVFVPFHDPVVGPATVTSDKQIFKAALNIVHVYGGGDCPEKSLGGIQLALNVSRPRSFLYVFTDATAGDHRLVGKVLDAVQRKQSQVVFVLTGHCNDLHKPSYKVYQQIAAASSGQVFNLNKTSVHEVLNFVRNAIKGRTVNLGSIIKPAGYNFTQGIPVDSSVGEVTVSVSGAKPHIKVVDPSGQELTGPPKLVKTLDLSEIMVVKVLEPEPGNWSITVGSEKDYSVKVVGLSNLTFDHGFSVEPPSSMAETSYRPLQGTYNHMLLSLSGADKPLYMRYAEVLDYGGKTLFEVPLREIDKDKHLYLTNAFVPPHDFFYIAINGRDEFNEEVRRVGSTAVQSKPPDVPYLTTAKMIEAHSHTHISLKCNVESLVPVTAKWTKDMDALQPEISSLQTTTIEYVIEDMTEEDVGTYTCVAKNVAGISKAITEVVLLVDPPQVTIEPANTTLELGEDIVVSCTVLSEALLLKHQLVFNGSDKNYTIDINLEPNMEGYYTYEKIIRKSTEKEAGLFTCIASNRGGEVKQSTKIVVNAQPISQILGSHPLDTDYNADVQLVCHVENAELLQWIAPNGFVTECHVNGTSTEILDVNNVTEDGSWQCVAIRGALKVSDSVELKVLIKPVASIVGSNNITVVNGTTHELVCEVKAKPTPTIIWFKGRDKLSSDATISSEPNVYRSVLKLNSSNENVHGNYTCFGENSAGKSKDNVIVNVRRKMTLLQGFNDTSVEFHSRAELHCQVDAYPPPKISWFYNKTQLYTTDNVGLSEDAATVYFKRVDVDNLGFYSCEADNGYETLHINGTLSIVGLDVPCLTTTPKIEAYSHTRVSLKCYVESIVPVTTVWTKNMIVLQPEISSLRSTTIEYVIEDMTEEDAGTYTCVAKNLAGFRKAVTNVELLVHPPQVSLEPGNTTIDVGEDVAISCNILSETLLLKYQFVFNGTKRDYTVNYTEPSVKEHYGYNKTIHDVTEKDAGIYTCIAANRGGESSQSINITVKARPSSQIIGSHLLSIAYNTDVQLICHVDKAELVQWIAPNGSIVERSVNGSCTEVLNVNNITEDGSWECVAIRRALKASDSVELKVLIKPVASILGSNNITVLNGTTHDIICEVKAKPTPTIIWFRGRDKLPSGSTVSNEPNLYRNVLTLNSSNEDVQGNYVCSGENSFGSAKVNVTINVRRRMTLLQGFNDSSVELYSQIELQCQVDAYPEPKINWFHNGTQLSTTVNVHLSEDSATVYIKMVDFNDLGFYTCEADNGFETLRVNGTLSVYGLEIPFVSKDMKKQIARKGDTTNIACRIIRGKPEPSITWQHRNSSSEVFTSLSQNITIDELDEVVIFNVTVEHSGVYRCTAENILGSDSNDIELVIQYPPTLSLPVEEKIHKKVHEVRAGEKVEFSCNAVGSPKPIVIWTKDGHPLAYSKNVHLSNENHLIIEKASRHDSGLFTCNATSTLGSVHRNFTLYIYVPPKIVQTGNETLQEMLEGQLVELPCVAEGEPSPRVQWTHNGDIIEYGRKYVDEFGLRFVANLTDFGNYTCNAWSPYGNTSVSYSLYVWVAPYIEPPLEISKHILVGSNMTLQCDVVGFPIPDIVWEFEENFLSNNTINISFNNDGNLYITNSSSKHEGVYVCVAENLAGVARKSIYLKINEPPKIIEDNFTGPYVATHKDTALMLTCKGTGKPPPYVVWSKDGFYLDKDNRFDVATDGTLTIKSPSEEESGNYTCNLKNPYGSVDKTFEVRVYSLPTNTQADESQSKMTLIEGTTATLDCPIPASATDTVKWYKEAVLIATGTLHIMNVTRSNSSTLACVVSNVAGSGYATVFIIVEWKPRFINDAERQVEAVKGDDVYLDCQVDAKPVAKIKWLFNSKRLVFQDEYRLKLMSVKQHEAGTYKCIVNNVHGTIVREFNLIVLEPPFISEFDLLDVFLKEGVNATLECNANGFPRPNLEWSYNNTNWHMENGTLIGSNVTSLSEGLYRCDARNKAGAAHLVYRVEVVTSPRIEEIVTFTAGEGVSVERTVELVLNTRARISCRATGKPTPTIQWLRNGRTVAFNPTDIGYADLLLENTQTTQAGVYTCVSANEGGSDLRKIKVDVLEPPQIFQTLFQNVNNSQNDINIEVISGQAFYLHCHPYGNPLPEVYWFKDELPLRFYDETMVSTEFGEIIVAKKATEEQTGNYTCVAKNKVGNTSISYLIDVLVPPPKPKESTKQVATLFGKELRLMCPVEGTPLPNVMWVKHPYTEINEETPRMMLLEDNFILVINETEVSDSGNYSCVMTNKVGTTEVVFQVTVHKPPRIVGNKDTNVVERHVVPIRRSLVLKCEVEGSPTPRITWLKDTQQLSDSLSNIHRVLGNSLLAIWSANVRDAGQYICVAENEAGAQHRRFNVAIQVPGKWSSWNEWTICNATCGLGYQSRTRFCHYIDENNNTIDNTTQYEKVILDETACKGPVSERRKCHMPACDNEGNIPKWSVWSKWSSCSSTCGVGTRARTRRCKSKAKCQGDNVQIRKCQNLPQCERHQGQQNTSNDVFDSKEDSNDTNLYIPEAVYEMEPEVIMNTHYSTGSEEFYLAAVPKRSMVYDVIVTENLDQSERGPCDPGYSHNYTNNSCDDIDECVMENNHCHSTQVCVNTKGGYQCTCPPGYVSLGLGQRCLDINECEQEIHGCEFACVNVAGGYVCACPRHLRLHLDKHHCVHPSLYQKPYEQLESGEFMSTSVDAPLKYTKNTRY